MPTVKKENESNVILEINGFQLRKNTLYEITEKLDSTAPDGFKEYGTTKVLSNQVTDRVPGAVYDTDRNIWDTGLYATSKSFTRTIPESLRASVLRDLQNNIVKPFESEKGALALDHTAKNNHFWDRYSIELQKGKVFDTSKPDDLLKVFLILIHKKVAPKEMESHPEYKSSMYCIVDKDVVVNREAERNMKTTKANGLFYNLLNNDRQGLLQVFDYVGIRASESTNDASLSTVFTNFINSKEDKFQNIAIFIDAVEKYATEEGQEEFYIHYKLKELYTKTSKVKKTKEGVFMDDVFVATNWKYAATKIMEDSELKEIFSSLDS